MSERTGLVIVSVIAATSITLQVSSSFLQGHQELTALEGGYSWHKDDLGGETNHGITEGVARSYGYTGAMIDLPYELALEISYERYWKVLKLDDIAELDHTPDSFYTELAIELYKFGFNAGVGRSAYVLQRCLNVLNKNETLWYDIATDRKIGRRTLRALRQYHQYQLDRNGAPINQCVSSLIGGYYVSISEARPQNQSFTYGWLNRISD